MTDSDTLMQPRPRIMIFIDFWNYELTMKDLDSEFLTDWFKLPEAIVEEAGKILGEPLQYERCFIFGSYDPDSKKDIKLKAWATRVLSKIPGVQVSFVPRQKRRKGPFCIGDKGDEHHEITVCPVCQSSMLGTQEKGVDTQLVTEMLDMAFSDRCDVVVLLSADKDFIPAVEKLINRNIKVIHASFPKHGNELSAKSWASFDLFEIRENFHR